MVGQVDFEYVGSARQKGPRFGEALLAVKKEPHLIKQQAKPLRILRQHVLRQRNRFAMQILGFYPSIVGCRAKRLPVEAMGLGDLGNSRGVIGGRKCGSAANFSRRAILFNKVATTSDLGMYCR